MMKFLALISLAPIVCLGNVNLCNLPDSWKLSDPPDALPSALEASGMNCEAYYVDSLTSGVLAQVFRPRSGPMTTPEYDGSVAGLQEGYAKSMSKNGATVLMNGLIKHESVELLHQEYRRDGFAFFTITQVAANGFHQVIAVVPEVNYDDSLQLVLSSFTPVGPPLSSATSTKFDEGHESGKVLGQALAIALIFVVSCGCIGFALWRSRKRNYPPPLPKS